MEVDYNLMPDDVSSSPGIVLKRARARTSAGGTLSNNATAPETMLPNTRRMRLKKLQDQAAAVESAQPDFGQLQEFAKQQGQQGEAAMLNALAAQFAGDSFQPLQGEFLKRAATASEPMKIGGGMLTPDGQFLRDPVASRNQELARLDRLIGAEQDDITAEERAEQARLDRLDRQEEARRRDERDYQFRLDNRDFQRRMSQDSRNAATDGKSFTRETTLRTEYGRKAEKISEGTRHAETVMTLLTDPTIANDPTKQVSLVFAFGKMLDPESVVRESEYALIANARGMFESLLQKPDQIMTGARLTPQQLRSMQQVAQQLFAGSSQRRQDLANYYSDIAARNRLNPENILPPGSRGQAPGSGSGSFQDPEKERRYQEWKRQQGGGKQ